MSLVEVHARLGNTALLYTVILAVWAFIRYFRRQGVESSFWGALAIAEVLYLVQGGLGAFIWLSGVGVPAGVGMHLLYGIVSLLVVPAVFLYTRGREERRVMLIYGVALLFQVGIILRAMSTGGG